MDARKLPKTQTKRPKLRIFRQKDANVIANSEDPDQNAPLRSILIRVFTVCHYTFNCSLGAV